MNGPQVSKAHYQFGRYGFEGRFVSYYYQLREVFSRTPVSILEIGVGDGVFGHFVRTTAGIPYRSVDIAPDLNPDILGSVTELPLSDSSDDIACAFEVLEHIPFEDFDRAVGELARVARRYVVLSLPHFGPMCAFSLKVPGIPLIRLAYKLPFPKAHIFNGQHYWEIGKKGFPLSLIRERLEKHGRIVADYVPFNSPYHHFFVLELRK